MKFQVMSCISGKSFHLQLLANLSYSKLVVALEDKENETKMLVKKVADVTDWHVNLTFISCRPNGPKTKMIFLIDLLKLFICTRFFFSFSHVKPTNTFTAEKNLFSACFHRFCTTLMWRRAAAQNYLNGCINDLKNKKKTLNLHVSDLCF